MNTNAAYKVQRFNRHGDLIFTQVFATQAAAQAYKAKVDAQPSDIRYGITSTVTVQK